MTTSRRLLDPTAIARLAAAAVGELAKLRATNHAANVGEPLRTVSAGGNHHALVAAALVRANVPELIARDEAARWAPARRRVAAYA